MLQATLNFSDGTVEQQLRKELGERDQRIDELTTRLRELDATVANVQHSRQEADSIIDDLTQRIQRYQETVKQLMIDVARTQRRDARRWQHQQHFELGHIASAHSPIHGVHEVWIEGNQWRRLMTALSDIHNRQREVEASRRPKPRTSSSAKGGGAASSGSSSGAAAADDAESSMLDVEEEAEMRRMELAALKTQEQQVQMQMAQHKEDKEAFVKEVRRIHDEDASAFALLETIGPMLPSDATDTSNLLGSSNAGGAVGGGGYGGALAAPQSANAVVRHQERYVLQQLLGRGGFSEVWKAFDLYEGRYVACKVHKVNRQWSGAAQANYLKHAERELEIQRQLDHPRLMKLYDVFQIDASTFVSVMEYSAGEDLEKRLKRCRTLREAEAKIILMQILSALRHLAEQDQPVIHYDLKPANIIFHSPLPSCLEVKVTDFGLSKVVQDAAQQGISNDPSVELTSQQCGTFWYLPPECFTVGAKISHKVDIWATGVIFYQMLYGKRPFAAEASQAEIYNNKLIVSSARRGVDFPVKPVVSAEAKALITKCLSFDVAHRPDISQLCADPYFHSAKKRARGVVGPAAPTQAVLAQPRPVAVTGSPTMDTAGMLPPA